MITEILMTVAAITGAISAGLHVAHLLGLDGLAAAKVDQIADAAVAKALSTPDLSDDGIAKAEAKVLHSVAQLVRDGKLELAVSALQTLAKRKAG